MSNDGSGGYLLPYEPEMFKRLEAERLERTEAITRMFAPLKAMGIDVVVDDDYMTLYLNGQFIVEFRSWHDYDSRS